MKTFILTNVKHRLSHFKVVDANFNFRCPVCGDSKKIKNKARGWLYYSKKTCSYNFYCYNCITSLTFKNFLNKCFPELSPVYNRYVVESKGILKKSTNKLDTPVPTFDHELKNKLLKATTPISKNSVVGEYCNNRNIKQSNFREIDKISSFISDWKGNIFPKLVIPFFDTSSNLTFVQFRSVLPQDTSPKYLTFSTSQNTDKIYGLDRLNPDTTFYIFEGALDSALVENAIAVCDSKVHKYFDSNENAIYVPDPDYDNPQILKIINEIIDNMKPIVLFPKMGYDLSDFHLDFPLKSIDKYLKSNTYSGLSAKLRLAEILKK